MTHALNLAPADKLSEWTPPSRTALCIVDVQNDFAAPDGLLGSYGIDMTEVSKAIAQIKRLILGAREAGVPVVFIGLSTEETTDSPAWQEWMRRQGRDPSQESAICRKDTPGAEFYELSPEPDDLIIWKAKYSAFWQTPFDEELKARGIDTLVVTGITTECCVDSTVRDAFHHDYHLILPVDACAAYEEEVHLASLQALAMNCALLTNTEDQLKAWSA